MSPLERSKVGRYSFMARSTDNNGSHPQAIEWFLEGITPSADAAAHWAQVPDKLFGSLRARWKALTDWVWPSSPHLPSFSCHEWTVLASIQMDSQITFWPIEHPLRIQGGHPTDRSSEHQSSVFGSLFLPVKLTGRPLAHHKLSAWPISRGCCDRMEEGRVMFQAALRLSCLV